MVHKFLKECEGMTFEEEPNYAKLKNLFEANIFEDFDEVIDEGVDEFIKRYLKEVIDQE